MLLTGATGYVGGRLLAELLRRGGTVRCLTRRPEALAARAGCRVHVVAGDVNDPASLPGPLAGVDVAYYLVHAMAGTGDFERTEIRAARAFAAAAAATGVGRIVYLGGLGHGPRLSAHLRSRQEVGRVLAASGVPTLGLRASIVIGSGAPPTRWCGRSSTACP